MSHISTLKLNHDGNTVGGENCEESRKQQLNMFVRIELQTILHLTLNHIFQAKCKISREDIAELLKTKWTKYHDVKRFGLIVEGLYHGFDGNFVVAAHLLMPQLEHFLHDALESLAGVDLTNLTGVKQNEKTLEPIIKGLVDYNTSLFEELSFFLCHGSDVNFRNNLAHGYLELEELERYSPYFWWLCLSIFLSPEKIFLRDNNVSQEE